MSPFLLVIVGIAFTVEAALGFGATLVTVTLGALLVDIGPLLVAFVPLNLFLSLTLVVRSRKEIDHRLLWRRVIPLMAAMLPIGMWAARTVDASLLKRLFGAFVCVLAASSLFGHGPKAMNRRREFTDTLLLLLGGMVHGAFATGGPMAVYVLSTRIEEKRAFRGTLSLLWAVLNTALLVGFLVDGTMNAASLTLSGKMAGALVVGLVGGEWLHKRVPEKRFRMAVWAMLAVGGLTLAIRG